MAWVLVIFGLVFMFAGALEASGSTDKARGARGAAIGGGGFLCVVLGVALRALT